MKVFDLRIPLGWLFATLGLLLVIAGLSATPASDPRSLGVNINLIWGAIMTAPQMRLMFTPNERGSDAGVALRPAITSRRPSVAKSQPNGIRRSKTFMPGYQKMMFKIRTSKRTIAPSVAEI